MELSENNIPLLIAQVEPPQLEGSGDYFYRTHAPGIAMAQNDGVRVINLTNQHRRKTEIMMRADVLILKNICDPDILPLIRGRKEQQKLTVYEIADDLNALQKWNSLYFFWNSRENIDLGFRLANSSNALQVSSPELKKLYGYLNKNCRVFPNQILKVPPEKPLMENNEFVIGWGGSHGHMEDIAEIAQPLINWIITRPNVSLHLMCSEPIWKLFDSLPQHKKKWTLPGSLDDYYDFLKNIDIGIAPLKDFAFNRSRSDVKFLEYAISGIVPVMAHLEPYIESVNIGKTGFLFKNTSELIVTLNLLADDPSLAQNIAKEARQYVIRERLQLQHGQVRLDFYRQHLKLHPRHNDKIEENNKWFEELSKREGAVTNERHLQLKATRFEDLLHDGLLAMQIQRNMQLAFKIFEEAATLEPKSYLPFMFAASITPDPIACLSNALKQEPYSIKSWTLLGEEFEKVGKVKEALECYESAINVYSDYEIPYQKIGTLLKKLGRQSQANQFFKKADIIAENLKGLNNQKPGIDLPVVLQNN
jgi:glycosyltransferase involved in cell wall biosynthesis